MTEDLSAPVRYDRPIYDQLHVIVARQQAFKLITEDKKLAGLASEIDKDLLARAGLQLLTATLR